jgi:hypothetical protein
MGWACLSTQTWHSTVGNFDCTRQGWVRLGSQGKVSICTKGNFDCTRQSEMGLCFQRKLGTIPLITLIALGRVGWDFAPS